MNIGLFITRMTNLCDVSGKIYWSSVKVLRLCQLKIEK